MSILSILQIGARIFPIIAEVVQGVEAVHSDHSGDAKKKLAIDLVTTIYNASGPALPFEQIAEVASNTIDTLVKSYNEQGKFTNSPVQPEKEAA